MKRLILHGIVVIELVVIVLLIKQLLSVIQRTQILGTQVTRLPKEQYIASSSPAFAYFYEPDRDMTTEDTWPFLPGPVVNYTNRDGMHSTAEYAIPKPDNVFRIVALGDSFTYGLHVNTDDAWPNHLQTLLTSRHPCGDGTSFEVINMGVPGYDLMYEVERFRLRGVPYQPDVVLWMLLDNDFLDINEYMRPIANALYEDMKANNTLDSTNEWFIPMEEAKKQMNSVYSQEKLLEILDSQIDIFSSVYDGRLVFVSFPYLEKPFQNRIQRWTKERPHTGYFTGLPNIETEKLILKDGHPDKEGHKRIAESIYSYIESAIGISCQNDEKE